jgi:hypothetical protein
MNHALMLSNQVFKSARITIAASGYPAFVICGDHALIFNWLDNRGREVLCTIC